MSDAALTQPPSPKPDPAQTHVAAEIKLGNPLVSCRIDPAGQRVLAGAEDMTIRRHDLASAAAATLSGHSSWVRSLGFSPDGQTLYSGGYEGRLAWWPVTAENPAPARSVEAHAGWIRGLAVSPDGQFVATGGNDNLVKLWNTADGALVRELPGHAANVYSVLFHSSGQFVLSGDLLGQIHQWEVATGKLVRTFDGKDLHTYEGGQQVHYGGVRSMALSPDGKSLACAGLHKGSNPLGAVNEPLVVVFDWETGQRRISHASAEKGVAWRVVYHPDGYLIVGVGGSGGGMVMFFKPDAEKEFFLFKMPNTVRDLDLHPDGLRIVTAHHDGHLRVCRMAPKSA